MKFRRIALTALGRIFFLFVLLNSVICFAWESYQRELVGQNIISLAKSESSSVVYAASLSSVFISEDKAGSGKKIFDIRKANKKINRIYVYLNATEEIYVLTQGGVYQSKNQGRDWRRIFRGSSDLENNCRSMLKTKQAMFLGTEAGLFISYDQGSSWQRSFQQFSDSLVTSLIAHPRNEKIIYLVCEKGVFISRDIGKTWRRIYVFYRREIPAEDYADYDGDVATEELGIKAIAISSRSPYRLYLATTTGLFFSNNQGKNWQSLSRSGLPTLDILEMSVSKDDGFLYLATSKGVFKFSDNHWQSTFSNLANKKINDMLIDSQGIFWLATKQGILKIDSLRKDSEARHWEGQGVGQANFSGEDIDNLFQAEPTIEQVQRAAIEYSETNMDKIRSWRRQSRLKALFPTVSVGYDKSVYGSSSGAMSVGPRDWSLDISWDIADLIWSTDQTTIDSRSRLTVQLRQDILDQVTSLYFQRRRLRLEMLFSPPQNQAQRVNKQLELEQLTASIDGLTNGFFSRSIRKNNKTP